MPESPREKTRICIANSLEAKNPMPFPENTNATAWVSVRPAGNIPQQPPHSMNLEEWRPDPAALAEAVRRFQDVGFVVGAPQVGAFSITAPISLFERYFGVELCISGRGGIVCSGGEAELPLEHLPGSLPSLLHGVAFECPLDFGPENFL
jgi:hypothetical protein